MKKPPVEIKSVKIAGKQYLTDFFWINVSNAQARAWEAEARNRAARHHRNLCLLRLGRIQKHPYQYGLHESIPNVSPRKIPRSLALSVVNGFPFRNFLGIFSVDGGWWVCMMRNGQLMLTGDQFFSSKEEALEFFNQSKTSYSWDNNEVLNLSEDPKESEKRIEDFISLGGYANRNGYVDFTFKPKNYKMMALLLLLGIIGGAAWLCKDLVSFEHVVPPESPDVLFPRKWESKPDPWDLFKACEETMANVPLTQNLWTMTEAICTEKGITAKYKRGENASYMHLPKGARIKDMRKIDIAEKTVPLVRKPNKRKGGAIAPQDKVFLSLQEFFRMSRNFGVKPVINSRPPESTTSGDPPVQVKAKYGMITYKINVPQFPREIFAHVAKTPGATLDSLKITLKDINLSWEFSGTVYGSVK